jgi:hypothetical protein
LDNDSDNDGICDEDEIVGCQNPSACNYISTATDVGDCILPTGCETCSGATDGTGIVLDNDSDNDGICDKDEIVGCQNPSACNYISTATDVGDCILPTGCETCSGATDGTGIVLDNDSDNDGICDKDEILCGVGTKLVHTKCIVSSNDGEYCSQLKNAYIGCCKSTSNQIKRDKKCGVGTKLNGTKCIVSSNGGVNEDCWHIKNAYKSGDCDCV